MLKKITLFISIIILQISCSEDNNISETDNSFIQKKVNGYLQITTDNTIPVTLLTKDTDLNNTGLKYDSQHETSRGFFEFSNIKLTSNFIELSYLGENTLSALADISFSNAININLITHIEKQRIETLVNNGNSFSDASKIAQKELLENFHITNTEVRESIFFNILSGSEEGAILIAIISIIDNSNVDVIIEDFKTDGTFNESTLNELYSNVSKLNLETVRNNFRNRYSYTPPNFEKYILNFKKTAVDTIYQVTIETNNNLCFNTENGSITTNITGGTPPYTYLWSNGETTKNITNLKSGTYSVIVNDSNEIQKIINDIEIIDIPTEDISISGEITNILNGENANILTVISGGTPPYTYLWSNGETNQNLNNINTTGDYKLTITDANGCTKEEEFAIYETIQDIDGNTYKVKTIGNQTWMIENLKVTKYNDGEDLIFIPNANKWNENLKYNAEAQSPNSGYSSINSGYTFYNFNTSEYKNYGAYYNNQVIFSSKNICPNGWKIPDADSFRELTSNTGCNTLNMNCLTEAGFSPVNSSFFEGYYENIPHLIFRNENAGHWWSSTIVNAGLRSFTLIDTTFPQSSNPLSYSDLSWGLCIRCIKE